MVIQARIALDKPGSGRRARHRLGGTVSAAPGNAARRCRRDAGSGLRLSTGGALAVKYALDAIADPQQARPDRLVLILPMIGITRLARFAGLAGLPAMLPAFAKAAWLGVVPEFNPFKYNSFPVNGARQSYRLTQALQQQIARYSRTSQLAFLPPIITFQSVMDFTVSTSAIVSALYSHLPSNGSKLVLFDVNRTVKFGPLLRPSADTALARLFPAGVRLTERRSSPMPMSNGEEVERTIEAGTLNEHDRALGITYPAGLYSLSHVALPVPLSDGLYGLTPDPADDFGINLGALAPRGERNVLIARCFAPRRFQSFLSLHDLADRRGHQWPDRSSEGHHGFCLRSRPRNRRSSIGLELQ